MIFSDEFISGLPDNWEEAALKVIDLWEMNRKSGENLRDTRDLLVELADAYSVDLTIPENSVGTMEAISKLRAELQREAQKKEAILRENAKKERFRVLIGKTFHYTFSDADVARLQIIINDMRRIISHELQFEEGHRERMLSRLESLQAELHKRVSNLDKFWGFVGDAGVALGKFGRDAKPLVDRIREMTSITWRVQANAEKLPSSSKPMFLDHDDEQSAES